MTSKGIDVSDHNNVTSWADVHAAGYSFAFVKTTQGVRFVSPTAATQIAGANNAGIDVYAYHYADGTGTADAQAAHFHASTPRWIDTLVLDIEPPFTIANRETLVTWVGAFLASLRARRPGATLGVYMDLSDLTGHDWHTVAGETFLWVPNPSRHAIPLSAWKTPTYVQGSSDAVPGITGHVDIDTRIEDTVSDDTTYSVTDNTKTPPVQRRMTEGQMTAETYELITQLYAKLVQGR